MLDNLIRHRRIILTKRLLHQLAIEPERLRVEWISASEGAKFARVVTEFTQQIKSIGPNPMKRDKDV